MNLKQSIFAAGSVALVVFSGWIRTCSAGAPVFIGNPTGGTVSVDEINHNDWNEILTKYVDENGLIDYQGLHASAQDRNKLRGYIGQLSTASLGAQASREGKLAFWINAYNAVTVEGILQKYPTTSIRNHTSKLGGYNLWHDLQLYVDGRPHSLDSIEHQILRKMNEPRIHFAIVCASIGCPRLLNEAYTPAMLEKQLETNAKDFFSREQNFKHDTGNNRFYVSAILEWFGGDFGANQSAQLQRISPWLPNTQAQRAAIQNSVSVKSLDYNWELNEQKK
jgi:hypothetical protein